MPCRGNSHEPVGVFGHHYHLAGRTKAGGVADHAVDLRRADLQHGQPAILPAGQHGRGNERGGQGVGSVEIEIRLLEPQGEAGGLRGAAQRGAGHGRRVDLHAEIRTVRGGKNNPAIRIDEVDVVGADRFRGAAEERREARGGGSVEVFVERTILPGGGKCADGLGRARVHREDEQVAFLPAQERFDLPAEIVGYGPEVVFDLVSEKLPGGAGGEKRGGDERQQSEEQKPDEQLPGDAGAAGPFHGTGASSSRGLTHFPPQEAERSFCQLSQSARVRKSGKGIGRTGLSEDHTMSNCPSGRMRPRRAYFQAWCVGPSM